MFAGHKHTTGSNVRCIGALSMLPRLGLVALMITVVTSPAALIWAIVAILVNRIARMSLCVNGDKRCW